MSVTLAQASSTTHRAIAEVSLIATSVSTVTQNVAVPSLNLFSQLTATTYLAEVKFGSGALTYSGTGTVTATLSLPSSLSLGSGEGLTRSASNGSAVVSNQRSITITGTVDEVNAVLQGTGGTLT